MRRQLASSAERAAHEEKLFLDEIIALFLHTSREQSNISRELCESLLAWGGELAKLSLLEESVRMYEEAFDAGINRYPDLYARCLVDKSAVLANMGQFAEAEALLSSLARRPYLIADRNLVPELLLTLGTEALRRGNSSAFKALLFAGLRHFHTSFESRKTIFDHLCTSYRRSCRVWRDGAVTFADKLLYSMHRAYFLLQRIAWLRYAGLPGVIRFWLLGYIYILHYVIGSRGARQERVVTDGPRSVGRRGHRTHRLVTRAMGGIGDLLMMTPGLHAVKLKYPDDEIHLAIPKRYFPVFEGNPDVTLLDIEHDEFIPDAYARWINLTDCPAARIESRTAPRVKRNRIDLFAGTLGIGWHHRRNMEKRPRYAVSAAESMFRIRFWNEHGLQQQRVIGVQLCSDEVYRDYPHMDELVASLARICSVILFDTEPIEGFDYPNVVKVGGLPMRQAFALLSGCNGVVAPDSSFVHLAAAFDIPTVALYGPVDGKVRTMDYPRCVYLDARYALGCIPCWRNDKIPCKLTGMRTSACLAHIPPATIISTLESMLGKAPDNHAR
jgi:tetratricopeptide (TPR) repeat protein